MSEDIIYYVQAYVEDVWECDMTIQDISTILSYQEWYYERLSTTAGYEGKTALAPIVQYIRLQAAIDGLKYSPDQVKVVLDAESAYWQELG